MTEIVESVREDTGLNPRVLKVNGGMTANHFLMQFQSDLLGLPLLVSNTKEMTALGIANLSSCSIRKHRLLQKTGYVEYRPKAAGRRGCKKLWEQWRSVLTHGLETGGC